MYDDQLLHRALRDVLAAEVVPDVDLAVIHRKMPLATPARTRPFFPRLLAATAVAIIIALLFTPSARAFVHYAESGIDAAFKALGIRSVPKPPAASLFSVKRHGINFTVVRPKGLPPMLRSERTIVAPVLAWDAKSKVWQAGPNVITYMYVRPNGTKFQLRAERYDVKTTLYAYMWEVERHPDGQAVVHDGRVVFIRRQWFHWRNGDQLMSALEGDTLTAAEIAHIRNAMHGEPLAGVKTRGPWGEHVRVE